MTSLNGDAFVMRNGRSTSQVSIYNYPEHLNPFYEDEQHKRLRFWKINKSNDGSGRRNSFSLGGLKDVWTFKSFRLKKKSSTLGINKTSESPPPLRRDLQPYNTLNGNDLSLPDYRTRYSTPAGINESFQRNAAYRSSLQNVASAKDNGGSHLDFNRNNQYRSTIQVMGTKSNNHNNNHLGLTPVPQPRRSSQISMASTNPFETDDDDEENNEDVSLAGDREMITSTPNKQRIHRKKRRAPAPPTVGVNKTYSSADSSLDTSQPPQPLPELRIEECMDIANLTAAIENFVKTTNDDTAEPTPTTTTNKQVEHEQTSSTPVIKQNGVANPVLEETLPSPSQVSPKVDKQKSGECVTTETEVSFEPNSVEVQILANQQQPNKEPEVGHVECIHVHTSIPQTPTATKRSNEVNQLTSFRGSQTRLPEPKQSITAKTSFTLTTPPATRRDSTKKAKMTLHTTEPLKFPETDELRITENTTTPRATKSPSAVKPVVAAKPHIAQIHKPARGITSTATGEHKEIMRDQREPPISPVPPIRQSTLTKHTQKTVTKETNTEKSLNIEPQNTKSTVLQAEAVPTASTEALTITESHENLLEKDETVSNDVKYSLVTTTAHRTQSPTELREEVLESLYRPKPTTSYMEWKNSSLAPLEKNVPPEKRKSVKDIIESINRSQRLLNASANKESAHNGSCLSIGPNTGNGTPLPQRKFSGQSTIERDIARDVQRTELDCNATASGGQHEELPTTSTAVAATLDDNHNVNGDGSCIAQDPQKLNNNEIFKKCTVKKEIQYDYREQSPTACNLDWNPVPKPKRNKNLSEQ